jgi:tetratricopeptide (TPR) repeat protein
MIKIPFLITTLLFLVVFPLAAQVERADWSDQICTCISESNVKENTKQFNTVYENCITQTLGRLKQDPVFLKVAEKEAKNVQKKLANLRLDLNTHCPTVVQHKAKVRAKTERVTYQLSASSYLNKIYQQGHYHFIRGQYGQAKKYFFNVLRSDSSFIEALDRLALCYRYTGRWDSTEYYFKKSLRIQPFGYFAIEQLGAAYYTQSKNHAALGQYRRLLELDPSNPDAYFGLAQVQAENPNTLSEAVEAIDRAIASYDILNDNNLCEAYLLKARIQFAQKERKKAKRTLKQAQAKGTEIPVNISKL